MTFKVIKLVFLKWKTERRGWIGGQVHGLDSVLQITDYLSYLVKSNLYRVDSFLILLVRRFELCLQIYNVSIRCAHRLIHTVNLCLDGAQHLVVFRMKVSQQFLGLGLYGTNCISGFHA